LTSTSRAKTTSIVRVARYLMNQSYSVVLAAGDTFRAGAIEQLEVHGNSLGLKVVKHKTGGDPAAVIFDAVERARLFNESVPIDGSILTKTDADAKGGSAISIAYITGKPVLFFRHRPDLFRPGEV
jgi:fused signal recognition particle receptor